MSTRRAAAFLVTSGFLAGVTQVLLIRELLLACFGSEVSLGLMLAAWLICGAVGALCARRWRLPEHTPRKTVIRALKLSAVAIPAVFVGIAFCRVYPLLAGAIPMRLAEAFQDNPKLERLFTVYLAIQPGEMLGPIHLVLISFGTSLIPAAIDGALFAVGLKAFEEAKQADPAAAGQAYALDAIGHLIGGVLLGWAVVVVLNPFTVACLAGGVLLVAVGALARGVGMRVRWLAATGAALLIALLIGSFDLHSRTADVRRRGRDIVDEVNSLYGHIAVARHGSEGVIFFGNGVPAGLSPALPCVQELVQFAMLQHRAPQRVLLVGGGATGGLLEALKHEPQHIDYAEIDPALLRFAEKWVTGPDKRAMDDPRVSKSAIDGRLIVKQAAAGARPKYDVIICLLPDPSTALLNRFYTQGWFREAGGALNPSGVLAWEMSSTRHYFSPSLLRLNTSILSAAATVFPRCALMTGDGSLAVAVGDRRAALSDDAEILRRRMSARKIDAPYFDAMAPDRLRPYNKQYVLAELAKSPPVAVNDDLAPVGYFYDQAVWIGFYSPDLEALYVRLGGVRPGDLWRPGLAALALLFLVGIHRAGRRAYVPLAILVTGALGMALELCLIFAFQAFYGYIYHQVGVIIGAFMVGLAIGAMGAAAAGRKLTGTRAASWALVGAQVAMGVLALALPAVLGAMSGGIGTASPLLPTVVFPLITAVIGLAVGAQFPLAAEAAGQHEGARDQARTAAGLYAADLLGASVGALAAGAVLIPVVGIPQTCVVAAVLSGGMAALLALRALLAR